MNVFDTMFSTSCQPAVRFAPVQATPGAARAFERGFADFPRGIESSAAYRDGYLFAEKRAQIENDARRELVDEDRAEYPGWSQRF